QRRGRPRQERINMRNDLGRDGSGTSPRTKSAQTESSQSGQSTVSSPRPTCSRVTTADGRSPGLRIIIPRRLPRYRDPVARDGEFTAYSCGGSCRFEFARTLTAFPFQSPKGTVALTVEPTRESCQCSVSVHMFAPAAAVMQRPRLHGTPFA